MLSIFFSDLQGFTSISEGLDPEALTQLLNDYLSAMTDIIHAEGGTVDKYEGDAIIAFWKHPGCGIMPSGSFSSVRCQNDSRNCAVFRARIGKICIWHRHHYRMAVVGNMGSAPL
jgi:adenylate cyclase